MTDIYQGYVRNDSTGSILIQVKDSSNKFGFYLCDDEQSYDFPPIGSWSPVTEENVPEEIKAQLAWVLEENKK